MVRKAGRAMLFLSLAGVASCNGGLMSFVLDLPPAAPRADSTLAAVGPRPGLFMPVDTVRPPIEATLDPDSTVNLLPRDNAGNIDWMEALRRGIVRPRSATPGDPVVGPPSTFRFGFDFYFEGPNPTFDAYFPHSAHTEWVACEHCHTRIFRYRDTQIQMADVLQGQYCGECHGKVAFPVITGCERCHTDFPQPPDRAQPDLIGDIVMTRFARTSATASADSAAADSVLVDGSEIDSALADSVRDDPAVVRPPPTDSAALDAIAADSTAADSTAADSTAAPDSASQRVQPTLTLPPATFPHWVHRVRYRCKACHVELFEPTAGANEITMSQIDEGQSCGRCHDGVTAFDAGFGECFRCHRSPPDAGTGGS